MGSNPSRDAIFCEHLDSKCSQVFTKDLLDKFLSSRATGTSPKTFRIYHLALCKFIGYPITPEGINAYLNSLTCGNAKHNYYRCIKTLCRWLYHTDQLISTPSSGDWGRLQGYTVTFNVVFVFTRSFKPSEVGSLPIWSATTLQA